MLAGIALPIFLIIGQAFSQSQAPPCCQKKQVGEVGYTLVGYRDTSQWGCKDSCVYRSSGGKNVCFKPGRLEATCQDGNGGSGSGWNGGDGSGWGGGSGGGWGGGSGGGWGGGSGGGWGDGSGAGGGGWPLEPMVENNYTAKGEMVDLDPNMKGYLVGEGKKVVVWSTGIFGLTGEMSGTKRDKEWADFIADEGGYTVLIPDWFRGSNMPVGTFDPAWILGITNWTSIESDWNNVVLPYLENRLGSDLDIGLIGTCWGSYPTILLSRFNIIKCGISMHPSHAALIPQVGQSEAEVLSHVVAPQLFMTEGGVVDSLKAGGIADEILGDKITFEEFNDMTHGWTTGGDLSDPIIARDVEKAKKLALEFLGKFL